MLDVTSINLQASDFYKALKTIVPTAQRSDGACSRALTETVRPLLLESLSFVLSRIEFIFPPAWKSVSKAAKEVQQMLEIEAILNQNLMSNVEALQAEANSGENVVALLDKRIEKEMSPSLPNCNHVLQKLNHRSISNYINEKVSKAADELPNGGKSRKSLFRINKLENVYYDLNEVVEGERGSILMTEQESVGEVANIDSVRVSPVSSIASTRYLNFTSHPHAIPPVHRPHLLISGLAGMGQSSHLAPAILHALEGFHIQTLDLPALFAVSSKTPEEACTQVSKLVICSVDIIVLVHLFMTVCCPHQ